MAQGALTVVKSEPLPPTSDLYVKSESAPAADLHVTKSEAATGLQARQAFFAAHPNLREATKATLNALPGVGAIAGGVVGVAGAPETGGGSLLAAPLGAGIGRGARDLLAEHLGVEPESGAGDKAQNIAVDTALTALIPGLIEVAKAPIRSVGEFLDMYRKVLPKWAQPEFLRSLPKTLGHTAPEEAPLTRPPWQSRVPPEQPSPTANTPANASGTGSLTMPPSTTPVVAAPPVAPTTTPAYAPVTAPATPPLAQATGTGATGTAAPAAAPSWADWHGWINEHPEIAMLREKLLNPKLKNNKMALDAIKAAIRARGGKVE